MAISKRKQQIQEKVGDGRTPRPVEEALDLGKSVASAKFDETVDVAINLGVDAKKSDRKSVV